MCSREVFCKELHITTHIEHSMAIFNLMVWDAGEMRRQERSGQRSHALRESVIGNRSKGLVQVATILHDSAKIEMLMNQGGAFAET